MTLLSPNHNYAADECIAQIPQHHIPTAEEKVRASQTFDKSILVAAHMAALHDAYIMEMATHPVNEVVIKPSSPTSSIGGLKRSTLKQLKVGKVHRRRVLTGTLCAKTLCTKTHSGLMVVNVLEDEEGNATPIYFSNAMEGNGGSAQAQQMYPQDSKVAVKEPYLTRLPDGEVVLLVEKTTDLAFLWVPENVKENGSTNGGTEDNGLHENGRDAFATEKDKDVSANAGALDGNAGKDGDVKVVDGENSNDKICKDSCIEEAAKSSKASRELKFEEEKSSVEVANDGVEVANDGESNEKLPGDAEENFRVESSIDEIKIEENAVDVKEKEAEEGEVDTIEVAKGDGNRELSYEDMLAMRNGAVRDGGDGEKELEGENRENVSEMLQVEPTQNENGGIEKDTLNRELGEGMHTDPPGDVDISETATNLRVRGNAIFGRGDYNKAVSIYTRAIEKARLDGLKTEEVWCLSNRAEVWLCLCRNQAAFEDADAALKLLRDSDGVNAGDLALAKALFRKGRALMGLHKYEDAMRVLQEVLAKAPADRQLREAAMKCRTRLQHVLKPGKRQRAAANRRKSASFAKQ